MLKQSLDISDVYKTVQASWAGSLLTSSTVSDAPGRFTSRPRGISDDADNVGRFYVRNSHRCVPLDTRCRSDVLGPEFTLHYNMYQAAKSTAAPPPAIVPLKP